MTTPLARYAALLSDAGDLAGFYPAANALAAASDAECDRLARPLETVRADLVRDTGSDEWQRLLDDDGFWELSRPNTVRRLARRLTDLGRVLYAAGVTPADLEAASLVEPPHVEHRADIFGLSDLGRRDGAESLQRVLDRLPDVPRDVPPVIGLCALPDAVIGVAVEATAVVRGRHWREGTAGLSGLLTEHGLTADVVLKAADRHPSSLHPTARGWLVGIAEDEALGRPAGESAPTDAGVTDSLPASAPEAPSAGPPVAKPTPPTQAEPPAPPPPVNSLRLSAKCWVVQFGDEKGSFPDRDGSGFRHLARLLFEPGRRTAPEGRLLATEFFPPAVGGGTGAEHASDAGLSGMNLGADDIADEQALAKYHRQLIELREDIDQAEADNDPGAKERAERERNDILECVRQAAGAGKVRRGKVGKRSSLLDNASQKLRMARNRVCEDLRVHGLPTLADHVKKYVSNENGEWWYEPPAGTSPWHVQK